MTRWHPWRHLRNHHPEVNVRFVDLGYCGCIGRWTVDGIEIDYTANQAERRCALTHELFHLDRGPMPDDARLAFREEQTVQLLTAQALIPLDPLVDALVWNRNRVNADTASDLWVNLPVLRTRLQRLTDDERAYIDDELRRRSPWTN